MAGRQSLERRRVHYSGRVQGVGFRFTAVSVAGRHGVSGYVRNLADGRVELVAEGVSDEIDRFLSDVAAAMDWAIADTEVERMPASGEFSGFGVRQ